MVREIAISLYLFLFKMIFNMFKRCPQKKKTVGVASFGDNILYTTNKIMETSDEEIIILKDSSCKYKFDNEQMTVIRFDIRHPISYIQSIYHLATASTILVDTYYGFLAVTNFRPGTTCVQLWHAAGAIKNFGLLDPSIEGRSKRAKDRFQQVYDRFDYTVVGSEKMANIFRKSFGLSNDRILRTGVPRTDFFYNTSKKGIYDKMKRKFPNIQDKKVLLYAPTYRKNQLSNYTLALDIKQLYENFSDEYVLLIKLHPAVSYKLKDEFKDFVYDVSRQKINHLLFITDTLITDYSSIPFEFSLLEKPMIFFAYDMEEYQKTNGLISDYTKQMPGPVVFTTEEIVESIKGNTFDMQKIKNFANDWNEYSKGNASLSLARALSRSVEIEEILV